MDGLALGHSVQFQKAVGRGAVLLRNAEQSLVLFDKMDFDGRKIDILVAIPFWCQTLGFLIVGKWGIFGC